MGRFKLITTVVPWPENQQRTDPSDPLVAVLRYKHPKYADVIVERFEAYTGLPFSWSNVKAMSATRFRDSVLEDVSRNSACEYCKKLSSAIHLFASSNGYDSSAITEALSIQGEQSSFVYVNETDIKLLIRFYKGEKDAMRKAVAAICILAFYTGARMSDAVELTTKNISGRTFIEKTSGILKPVDMLTYTSKKTHIEASIPIKPIVRDILESGAVRAVKLNTQKVDWHIKRICREVGMHRRVRERRAGFDTYKELCDCVTAHTFRRSFATMLDQKGVSIETTSRMMGHSNTEQTRRYVCDKTLVIDNEAMNFFK